MNKKNKNKILLNVLKGFNNNKKLNNKNFKKNFFKKKKKTFKTFFYKNFSIKKIILNKYKLKTNIY
jgi:hypothetical protein